MKNFYLRVRGLVVDHPIAASFVFLAVFVRLIFWFYTGRVWEDALMTMAPARNAWLGHGLTHHLSEPRVHSFTSPISVLIPLLGEAIGQGLLALRLTALAASAFTICYVYQIGRFFRFHWSAQILVLGYLATDQLQIFFGMSGMETQVATAIFVANMYYFLKEKWVVLGFVAGLGLLVRPEFVFCLFVIGLFMLIQHRQKILTASVGFLCVIIPWYVFAFTYYGSIVPNTIIAKSIGGQYGPFKQPLSVAWAYFQESWKNIAPFTEWYFISDIPLPLFLVEITVTLLIGLVLFGIARALRMREWGMIVITLSVVLFTTYRSVTELSTYYMWYLPPFIALLFVIAAYGLSAISYRYPKIGITLSLFVALMYAIHIPFSFAAEKNVQFLECEVRYKAGTLLNAMMGPTDSVVLEPLGYIGYGAFNKTTYDFPGVSSKVVINSMLKTPGYDMLKKPGYSLVDEIATLNPAFIVLRPNDIITLQQYHPNAARNYTPVADIKAPEGIELNKWGYESNGNLYDGEFIILQRISPPTEFGVQDAAVKPVGDDVYRICTP